jgi:hypothetical protein
MAEESKLDPDQLAEQVVQGISGFKALLQQGTLEEKKELVRAFVEKLELNPDTGKGVLYIRQFPASIAKTGNASFNMVAGARYSHQKKIFPPLQIEEIKFEYKGKALVPALG